jgi:DNA-binding HxlR family transcriptional regulator
MGVKFNRRNASAQAGGVVPGSAANRILLALRAGGMNAGELTERLREHNLNDQIRRLHELGLITREKHPGWPGFYHQITSAGLELVQPGGPLCYRAQPDVQAHSDLL